MGCFPCKEYKVQFKCIWQAASNWNINDFLQTSMKVSINKNLRELIWWLKCHISISWNSEKNENVEQRMLWVLCQKVQPANHHLHFPILLAWGWHGDPTGQPPTAECWGCGVTTQGYLQALHGQGPGGKHYHISSSQGTCPPSSPLETSCCRGRPP